MALNNEGNVSGREIVATRLFDAPRELLFAAWTDPKHISEWWGPRGFTTTVHEMDVRPGGRFLYMMHGPDGTDYPNKVVYREVVAPERIVYWHGSDDPSDTHVFTVTATFTEKQRGKTELTVRMLFETVEEREASAKFGATQGLHETLARLSELLARDIIITRLFDAPRELVFRAWTSEQQFGSWFGTHGFTNPVCEIDARPGGAMRIDMRGPDGSVYPNRGTVEEVSEPERFVFTLALLHDAGDKLIENHHTATFEERDGGTLLTLRVRVMHVAPAAARYVAGMREGWNQSFDRLGELTVGTKPFVFTRELDAPRDLVFRAWTERDHLVHWWGPKGFTVEALTNDLRPGGMMHYHLTSRGGGMWGRWVYRDVGPEERLSFVSSFSNAAAEITRAPFSDEIPFEILTTVLFAEENGRTTVMLRAVPIHATDAERAMLEGMHDSMSGGWGGTLDQLDAYLRSTR